MQWICGVELSGDKPRFADRESANVGVPFVGWRYDKDVASLKERNPADLDERLAKLEADWEKTKRSFVVKRALIEDHMQEATWYRQDQDKAIRRLGIDKQGNLITPDP